MEIATRIEGARGTLALAGKLTVQTSGELNAAVEALPRVVCDIDIDLSGVDYVSSAGMRALAAAGKLSERRGGRARLLRPQQGVRGIFERAGLAGVLAVEG